MNHFRRNFVAGLLILVPVVITYLVLRFVFDTVDGVLQPGIEAIFNRKFPGLGLVALVVLVYLAGLFGARVMGRQLVDLGQSLLLRAPIIKTVYSSSKQLIDSFSGVGQTGFKRVVMIEYPRSGAWAIGFFTGMTTDENGRKMGFVYIPTAPTPNSGWVALLSVEQIYDTDLTVGEAFRLTLSGGITTPEKIKKRPISDIGDLG